MRIRNAWAIALMWGGVALAQAQGVAPMAAAPLALVTNGCGSGRMGFLVPNKTWLSQCNFEASCNKHDVCYGKCLEGGALQGNTTCNVQADKQRRRTVCDAALQQDIIGANSGKSVCRMYASLYRFAVQAIGESFFHGAVASSNVEDQLSKFLRYVEKHPNDFDNVEIEQAFDTLTAPGLEGGDYTVLFQASVPRLAVFHQAKPVLTLMGKGNQ